MSNNNENFTYNLEKAQEEAKKMQEKIKSGEASDYKKAEKLVEAENSAEQEFSIDNFDIENYLKQIPFDVIVENTEDSVDYYHKEEKEKGSANALRFEHVNALNAVLGFHYALSQMSEKFSSIKEKIIDSRNIYAESNDLFGYIENSARDYGIKEGGKEAVKDGSEGMFLEHLLILKSLYLGETDNFEELEAINKGKKTIEKMFCLILESMQNKFKHKKKNKKGGSDGYGVFGPLAMDRFCNDLSNTLVVYKKLFPEAQETEVDVFIKNNYEKYKKLLIKFKEAEPEQYIGDEEDELDDNDKEYIRKNIFISLLKFNYLCPDDNILDEKDMGEIKSIIEKLIEKSLDSNENSLTRRIKSNEAMAFLGLIKDIKNMRSDEKI